MEFGDVVDQLLDQDGLTDTSTTEQTNFTTLGDRRDQVDDFDAGFQDFDPARLVNQWRRCAVNWRSFFERAAFAVDRFAGHVEHAAQGGVADRDADWRAGVSHDSAAGQTVGRAE